MAEHFFSNGTDSRPRTKSSTVKGELSENEPARAPQEPTSIKRKFSGVSIPQSSTHDHSKRPKVCNLLESDMTTILLLKVHDQETPPSKAAVTIDNVKLATSDKLDLLFQIDQKKAKMTYIRKPRSLVYNNAPQADYLNHLMVSSCLGGSVYLWNSKKRTVVNTIDRSQLNIETWPEDLCWVTPDTLAVPVAHKDGNHSQSQLLIMNVKDDAEVCLW